ncbi:MAG: twin-arginine translocation signal domain-containing protein [Desulfocapsa sp.]|nr:twin-arginine translocation signal domain-containing protein [Desulfocapsa sp.]
MKVTRREVLRTAAVASAMAAIGGPLANMAEAHYQQPLPYWPMGQYGRGC